jgi:hypothetical protein
MRPERQQTSLVSTAGGVLQSSIVGAESCLQARELADE